jgi:hypothetical protein
MNPQAKRTLIDTLVEMRVRLENAGVATGKIAAAVEGTANALAPQDYADIVRNVLPRTAAPAATKPQRIAVSRGTIVFLTPVDAPAIQFRYVVEADSATGDMLALWNGMNGTLAQRPTLTKQPDGRTWTTGAGVLYTVEMSR